MTFQAPNPAMMTLAQILAFKRPAGTKGEQFFVNRLKTLLEPYGARFDDYGNIIVTLGESPNVLWSCHTDTVHVKDGKQDVYIENGFYKTDDGECLGADDSTGIWLACQMIQAGKPGLYIFHREEECGGYGSLHIANKTPGLLDGIKIAIAFDRKAYTSVITHQGGRCCSDAFASSLCAGLGMGFKPDDTGLFTDTANYVDIIPECTNISVGYFGAHTPKETQDIGFTLDLLQALIALDVDALVVSRDPTVKEFSGRWSRGKSLSYGGWNSDDGWHGGYLGKPDAANDAAQSMADIVAENPDMVAAYLEECGFTVSDIIDYIENSDSRPWWKN